MIKIDPPVDVALGMKNQGFSNQKIFENLQSQGYSSSEISEALNQAEIKTNISGYNDEFQPSSVNVPEPQAVPEPSAQETKTLGNSYTPEPQPQQRYTQESEEKLQEIAEIIVDEKFKQIIPLLNEFNMFKERMKTEVISIKQELLRLENRFENMQKSVLSRVSEYGKGISDVSSELKAMEKVFENIINPLTTNIRELSKITEEMKGRK